jgi:hypothetical protein
MTTRYNHCEKEYGYTIEDSSNYGESWSSNLTSSSISDSFLYKHSNTLNSLPYYGKFSSYNGGGYVFKLIGETVEIQDKLSLLQKAKWIDRLTRSFFIEFILYNPNINLYSVCTILFEILPSGNMIKSSRFDTIYLVGVNLNGNDGTVVALFILYMVGVIFIMIKEGKQIYKLKWAYFKILWNYIDILLILFSWTSLAMFIYSIYYAYGFKTYLKETSGKDYIKMQIINYWNESLVIFLGICICFATLRLIKLLRFNSTINQLTFTFKQSFNELATISLIFILQFMAFSQTFYLILQDKLANYASFAKAFESCFAILLANFNAKDFLYGSSILGPLFLITFYSFGVLIILNMMISILSCNYINVQKKLPENEFHLFLKNYFTFIIKKFFKNYVSDEKGDIKVEKFDDKLKRIPFLLDSLGKRIEKYQKELNENDKLYYNEDSGQSQNITVKGKQKILKESKITISKLKMRTRNFYSH